MKAAAACLGLALLAACTDSSGPSENVDGVWTGAGQSFSVTLELTQRGDSVTGTGAAFGFVSSTASTFAVAGSYSQPHLTLAFSQDTTVLARFTATVAADGKSMDGVETFSGGADTLRFVRQP